MLDEIYLDPDIAAALAAVSFDDLPEFSAQQACTELKQVEHKRHLSFNFGFACASYFERFEASLSKALAPLEPSCSFDLSRQVIAGQAQGQLQNLEGVKNIVAVASGKGGVGKSTTTANLALALAAEGAKVGVLDADIYGPSQATMLGVADARPEMHSANRMKPITAAGGIQMMSMGNLVTEKTPMVWRGPMVSGALQQLLNQTHWQELDYLLIDMPPGTGDIQLTLSQAVPVTGSLIVTTPQDISLLDARKGIEMFRKVNIPVLGVVENMSLHRCSQCGHEEAIFGAHGGDKLASEYAVALLGQLPLDASICSATDRGEPPVLASPEAELSKKYRHIAVRMAAQLWLQQQHRPQAPTITISDD